MDQKTDTLTDTALVRGVGRLGFRKWYERELLSSHAHMVLALLSVIAMLASLEALRGGTPLEQAMDLVFVLLSAAVGLWALRRYLYLLMRAEELAHQASCPACGDYGRFRVVGHDHSNGQTQVRCRRCEQPWTIQNS